MRINLKCSRLKRSIILDILIQIEQVVDMFGFQASIPCDKERINRYCFPCISGLCPFEMDLIADCFPGLEPELVELFDELLALRAGAVSDNLKLKWIFV
jgi:hypothetical protein